MALIRGDRLMASQRNEVLSRYMSWHLDKTCRNADEWLSKHAFYFRKDGQLDGRRTHYEPAFMCDPIVLEPL